MYFGDIGMPKTTQRTNYYFICPFCLTELVRGYEPMNVVHCAVCNKSFPGKERQVMPDMFSLAKKPFKDIADIFCDRWTPKTAFIFDKFAVFQFHSKEHLEQMTTYIDAHELMFNGLDFVTDEKEHLMMTHTTDIVLAG